uniref:Uncharacterized protein n=1 Tax=Peronospora matthiolae TaxID=2874970 RepID=A0AAV1VKQ7_9STRA
MSTCRRKNRPPVLSVLSGSWSSPIYILSRLCSQLSASHLAKVNTFFQQHVLPAARSDQIILSRPMSLYLHVHIDTNMPTRSDGHVFS